MFRNTHANGRIITSPPLLAGLLALAFATGGSALAASETTFELSLEGSTITAHDLSSVALDKQALADPGLIEVAPLSFAVDSSLDPQLAEWLSTSVESGPAPRDLEVDVAGLDTPIDRVTFESAHIASITFPACEVGSEVPAALELVLEPQSLRYDKGDGVQHLDEDVGAKKWSCSNFRLEIDDLPTERVSKIDSFRWEVDVIENELGHFVSVPHLTLTVSMADYWNWYEWFKSSVVNGLDDQKSGSLTFFGPDMDEELMTISFDGLGILSLEQVEVEQQEEKEEVSRFVVELYVESMFFDVLGAS